MALKIAMASMLVAAMILPALFVIRRRMGKGRR
jgi:hypothetical protein